MNVDLTGDLYQYHIAIHLSVKSFMTVMCVSRYHYKQGNLNAHIISIMIKKLMSIFGDQYNNLKLILTRLGAVISGSFILQCILDETWDSDIDFYVSDLDNDINRGKSELDYFFYENYLQYNYRDITNYSCNLTITSIRDYLLVKNSNPEVKNAILATNVYAHRPYGKTITVNDVVYDVCKLQCIKINCRRDQLIQFIVHDYDFDLCKNVFYFTDSPHLYIHSLQDIINKTTKFKFTTNKYASKERKLKYEKRGFKFL